MSENVSGCCAPEFKPDFESEIARFVAQSLGSIYKYKAGSKEFGFFLKVLKDCHEFADYEE